MLYVAAWMKWDLKALEAGLPFVAQQVLMTTLVKRSCGVSYKDSVNMDRELSNLSVAEAAAAVTHARWVVRAVVQQNGVPLRPAKPNYIDSASVSPLHITLEEANGILVSLLPAATRCLEQVAVLGHALQFPPAQVKGCDDITNDLSSVTDLKCQIAFELAQLYMFRGEVSKATPLFALVSDLLPSVASDSKTCTVTDKDLHGFLVACGLPRKAPVGSPLQVTLDEIAKCRKSQFRVSHHVCKVNVCALCGSC